MFKRFRHLQVSLAAKFRSLFGAAVILIIGAALFVPWQRMEQLMDQINERTAKTLAEWIVWEHAKTQTEAANEVVAGRTAVPGKAAPTTAPTTVPASGSRERPKVKLVLIGNTAGLTSFETRALDQFRKDRDVKSLYRGKEYKEGPPSFQYAMALHARANCIGCHRTDLPPGTAKLDPAALAKRPPLLGMASVEIPYQVDANQVFVNRLFIFIAGLLAGVLAIVVFYLISTQLILRPVRVLRETAEKVSQGNLDIRSDISTGDEFQQLSETINRMLANLKQNEDQLRAINKGLDLKLDQLAESNLALYESNRLKSEFLANVSHELRTPLNSILGFADLLKDGGAAADPKALRYVQNILSSGKNLLDLINDLLDLAKIEAGKMEVRSEPLSLSDLFEGLINILKPLAEKKELALVASVGRDVPILETDPAKLQQVLYNFLANAIKFSPVSGRIDLLAEREDEPQQVRICVTDQGPGIPPEKQGMIFEKFRQIDGSHTREHGGTGLGLAISKELTTLLGGRIGLHSETGQGTTFWIVLPVKIVAEAKRIAAAAT
jgi:signal transduction histidine kinase